ncbi:MAG: ABC transporter permease [Actinomycetales bacterium]|nr:ABC transporter permease [Actinomycetales bacterium]
MTASRGVLAALRTSSITRGGWRRHGELDHGAEIAPPGGGAIEAPPGSLREGIADLHLGLRQWPAWWLLTWYALRSQYRRTYLGPWWITVQQVIFVAGLSLLFGVLFQQDLSTFVPYVATGYIAFTWMIGMLTGGATCILDNGAAIRTAPGPLSIYPLRTVASATIQFAHDALVIVAVVVAFDVPVGLSLLYLPVACGLIVINGLAIGLWLGPLCVRYRDVGQIITSLARVLFFFTPVFWVATNLTVGQLAVLSGWNPLTYLLQVFRAPLLGGSPSTFVLAVSVGLTLLNVILGVWYFSRTRPRLAYWL